MRMEALLSFVCTWEPVHIPKKAKGIKQRARPITCQLKIRPVTSIKVSRKNVSIKIANAIVALSTFGLLILKPR